MITTERLYYDDSYLRDFEARVVNVEPQGSHFRVFLDRTAFYPESGGQPMDTGTLGGSSVLAVTEEDEAIVHLVDRALSLDKVTGVIDWPRRFDHMQQHTGQHILSAAFEKAAEAKTISFHLGTETSTIDLDSDRLGQRQMEQAEEISNQIVFEDRPVHIRFYDRAEVERLDLRKPTERTGRIRVIEVEGFDCSACGGTHVSRTGAIGLILVRKIERRKDATRVEFVCGNRARQHARRDYQVLSQAAVLFSSSTGSVPALIAQQADDLKAALRSREKLMERLCELRARELWMAAPERHDTKTVRLVLAAEDTLEAKLLAHAVAKQPEAVGLVGVKGKPAALFFAQSVGGPRNMGAILKQTVEQVGGKGGGSRDFAQGGGLDEGRLEEALSLAEGLL